MSLGYYACPSVSKRAPLLRVSSHLGPKVLRVLRSPVSLHNTQVFWLLPIGRAGFKADFFQVVLFFHRTKDDCWPHSSLIIQVTLEQGPLQPVTWKYQSPGEATDFYLNTTAIIFTVDLKSQAVASRKASVSDPWTRFFFWVFCSVMLILLLGKKGDCEHQLPPAPVWVSLQ